MDTKRFMAVGLVALGLIVFEKSVNAQYNNAQRPPSAEDNAIPPSFSPAEISKPGFRTDPMALGAGSINRPRQEARVVRKGVLAPSAVDVARQQFLLSQPKTGLMRLLPRESFDSATYKVKAKVSLRGGGAYYSFHYLSHEYGYGSDISFDNGNLYVGFAGADYGMLTDLGDTELESIDAKDPRAGFLLNYKPPRNEAQARIEARKFWGFTVDGVRYQRRLPAEVNHTYLLRSINYDESDLLVAFRVVSKADDGGLTIAWKILKKFSTPQLLRANGRSAANPWKLSGW